MTWLEKLIQLIKTALNDKIGKDDTKPVTTIQVDETPMEDSTNLVTSGGVKEALDGKADKAPDGKAYMCDTPMEVTVGDVSYIHYPDSTTPLTHTQIKEAINDPSQFVYIKYNGALYIPQIDTDNIIHFIARTPSTSSATYPKTLRISVEVDNTVRIGYTQEEKTSNKTNAIDIDNPSEVKYPTENAVVNFLTNSTTYQSVVDYTVTDEDVAAGYTGYIFGDYKGTVATNLKLINNVDFKTKDYVIYATLPGASNSRIDIVQNTTNTKLALGTFARHATLLTTSNRYAKIEMQLKGKWTGLITYGSAMGELTSTQNIGYRALQTSECEVVGIQSNGVVFTAGTRFEIYAKKNSNIITYDDGNGVEY